MVHSWGFSPLWILRCVLRLDDVENPFSQMSQTWGRSPVCVLKCRLSNEGRSKHFPQNEQGNIFLWEARGLLFCCWFLLFLTTLLWPKTRKKSVCIFQIQQSGLFYSDKTIFETVEIDILSYLKWQKTVILQIWKRQKKMCFCPTKNALSTHCVRMYCVDYYCRWR